MSHAACSTSRQPAGWHKYLQSVAKKEINECEHYFFGLSLTSKLCFSVYNVHRVLFSPDIIHPSDKEGKLFVTFLGQ